MEINQGTLQNQRTKVNSKNQNKRRKTLDQKKKKKINICIILITNVECVYALLPPIC